MELDLPTSPPPVEATLAARRAKRQAIAAKYAGVASVDASSGTRPSSAVQPPPTSFSVSDPVSQSHSVIGTPGPSGIESTKEANGLSRSYPFMRPRLANLFIFYSFFTLGKRESLSASPAQATFTLAKDGEEEDAQVKVQAENSGAEQVSAADYDPSLDRREDEQKRVREPIPEVDVIEEEEEEDDVDDMFAVAIGDKKKVKKVKKVVSVLHFW